MSHPAPDTVLPAAAWRDFAVRLLEASHVPPGIASITADCLVYGSLSAIDSHGLQLLTFYLDQLADGRVDAAAEGAVLSEHAAILHYDGCNGLGQAVARRGVEHAVRLARQFGLGLVSVRNSNHFGPAGFWGERIASEGLIGVVLCNASCIVPPWQAKEPRWGTNPICVAVPGGQWMLDMATTTVAMGRIYKAGLAGQDQIPAGWAMDKEGRPTEHTQTALAGLLMPLGGYKGSGLAMMVEMLTGVLSGGAVGPEMGGLRVTTRPFAVSQFFLAIDPAAILGPGVFEHRAASLVELVRAAAPAAGFDEVLVAGELERRAREERGRQGVPVAAGVCRLLEAAARRLGVDSLPFATI